MKIKKILSSALVFVMLFTTVVAVLPLSALASENTSPVVSVKTDDDKTAAEIKEICQAYLDYEFDTAEQMLDYEIALGYLDTVSAGDYTLYVNRYTGVVYYVNNVTGQILLSNPHDPGKTTGVLSTSVTSQIELKYAALSSPANTTTFDSISWILKDSFLSVTAMNGGISVDYTLGEAVASLLAPGAVMASTFEEEMARPMFDKLAALMLQYCGELEGTLTSKGTTIYSYNLGDAENSESLRSYGEYEVTYIRYAIESLTQHAASVLGQSSTGYAEISAVATHINNLFGNYVVNNPHPELMDEGDPYLKLWYETYPTMEETGESVYSLRDSELVTLRLVDAAIKACCSGFNSDKVQSLEDECGYVSQMPAIPSFKCKLNYTLENDGTLVVDMPTSGIDFDDSVFMIHSITHLKNFGYADMTNDGYIFFPDGSGTVLDFDDFYFNTPGVNNISFSMNSKVYGQDYCYATVTGKHREQITMPVFGVVNEVKPNATTADLTSKETVTNGFLAILEDGASLAELGFLSLSTNKYASAFATYMPYHIDKYDISDVVSVAGSSAHYLVSDENYEGSFKTRIVMLADPDVAAEANTVNSTSTKYYNASYVGMAACYRDYLDDGTLDELTNIYEDIPLYIEALGSIDITKKILTFPVTVSTPLTTFEQVETMYGELSDAIEKLKAKARECDAAADEIEAKSYKSDEDRDNIESYRRKADNYEALAAKVKNITNINFRLTGFANGGMYYTYPSKASWESSVGGKRGFKSLLSAADAINSGTNVNANLGIYPDFDFAYINNTSMFDGVSQGRHASRMIDNRYASKQTYNSISGEFETLFAMVLSTSALDELYSKFEKRYSKYNATGISASTLGSDLNSNLDQDGVTNREASVKNIVSVLDRMANDDGYSIMVDKGNAYTLGYVDHIVNATIDSSHFGYSSYPVPFYGMVLHGYVSYAGTPFNFSGSSAYNMLHSIENGASLYYVLCYDNTHYLKEDPELSKYYGISYENWFDKIVEQYDILNDAIGDLQTYNIVDHRTIFAERIIDSEEMAANYESLAAEFVQLVDTQLSAAIVAKVTELRENGYFDKSLVVSADVDSLMALAADKINLSVAELEQIGLRDELDAVVKTYADLYPAEKNNVPVSNPEMLSFDATKLAYSSQYSYVTDSLATDKNYVKTDFTCDNKNVVLVTYANPDNPSQTTVFILNYNVYSVKVKVDTTVHQNIGQYVDEDGCITLDKYGFIKIN